VFDTWFVEQEATQGNIVGRNEDAGDSFLASVGILRKEQPTCDQMCSFLKRDRKDRSGECGRSCLDNMDQPNEESTTHAALTFDAQDR
jgi:hypothetical protein